jgi:hypothetical protein
VTPRPTKPAARPDKTALVKPSTVVNPRSPRSITGMSFADRASGPNDIRPATREEIFPIAMGAVVLGFIALIVCYSHGYLLLYGDAVAHLGIARRILDSRDPGLVQLGGVWLPLPHILLMPFVQRMDWWQNGLAGAWPSLAAYIVGVSGFYRLARRMVAPRWAFAATAFYALNPNLLFLGTTAMTEPLFLALLVWIVLLTIEAIEAIEAAKPVRTAWRLNLIGLLLFAAVMTRYDGWVLAAAVWCLLTWRLWRSKALWRTVAPSFALFTTLTLAGPVLWLWYNQHFFHDPLDFMRGPYSASGIEARTRPPGPGRYHGYHNPLYALLYYTRSAQIDASAWETGFAVFAAALAGLVLAVRRRVHRAALLLWLPLAFYVYSVAYGSIPIFIPQLYPHSYYNSRYGVELLPALALFFFLAAEAFERRLTPAHPLAARLLQPILLSLAILSSLIMMYRVPLVLKEAQVNSVTRMAFERAVAQIVDGFPAGVPILMETSAHVGIIQDAGIPLRQTVNENDWDTWHPALLAPAKHAAYVIAIAGDEVSKAVAAHPEGLTELTVLCTTGQPCARIYQSELFPMATP